MVTYLMEMRDLPNFGHTTTFAIKFESRNKILLLTLGTKIMTLLPLYQNTFIIRRVLNCNTEFKKIR